MKGFEAFYKSNEGLKEIWERSIFVFDANVLLNLYRYTEDTANDLLNILKNMDDQIWLPHQAAMEYHFNRETVILSQIESYNEIKSVFSKHAGIFKNELNAKLSTYKKKHPKVNVEELLEMINKTLNEINEIIEEKQEVHPKDLLREDPYLKDITDVFGSNVGECLYDQLKLNSIHKEGESRYSHQIPPGYKDLEGKKGQVRYWDGLLYKGEFGDLIVWNQIIDKANQEKKSIIFVTDDDKEDWWKIVKGKTLGPRIELINEFNNKTNQDFYMYKTYRFMEIAKELKDNIVSSESIKEAKDLKYGGSGRFLELAEEHLKKRYPDYSQNNMNIFKILNETYDSKIRNTLYIVEAIALAEMDENDIRVSVWGSDIGEHLIDIYTIYSHVEIGEIYDFNMFLDKFLSIDEIVKLLNANNNLFKVKKVRSSNV